ncbi:MAG: VWA domain-containing protein [Steroidobacteraceae bacterium]|nr:VWA domain-containing protein [Steroidobacteraceae bacterium]
MIHVAWPWMAALAPLPWIHRRVRADAQPGGAAIFLPFATTFESGRARVGGARRITRVLFSAIWILLVLAAMRPQWLGEPLPSPTTGRRILLAVDLSGSMATQDMANDASRLQVVQQVAGRFIDSRRGDQVGLILFGTRPYLQAPVTADLKTVHRFLDEAMVGMAGPQTAIGDAIGLAIKRLRAQPGQPASGRGAKHTVLILLTDGQSNTGALGPIQAAHFAKQVGLKIYTIGVGAPAGSGPFGLGGNNDLDEHALRQIAKITGGQYFRATDAHTLRAVYRRIDQLEPVAGRAQWLRPTDEWFLYPLALALLLSVPAAALGARSWL